MSSREEMEWNWTLWLSVCFIGTVQQCDFHIKYLHVGYYIHVCVYTMAFTLALACSAIECHAVPHSYLN